MDDWPDQVTPRDIAARLGIATARPDKKLRAWLRDIYPEHPRYERWMFTPREADSVVRRWRAERG